MKATVGNVRALVFDTFGSVVDWRGSIIRDLSAWGDSQHIQADWAALADQWRGLYQPQMQKVRSGERPWVNLDDLHRESLETLIPKYGLNHLSELQRDHVNRVWHRLDAWPDAIAGMTRLKSKYIIGSLSNGNVALLTNMAKHAGLPWDIILSTEWFHCYKPLPESYARACQMLALQPENVMMCAAHNDDLAAARKVGLKTAFWPRPTEYGPGQTKDLRAEQDWDVVAKDIRDLADQLIQP